MSDAKNLADAILFLPKEAHASCLALLEETTLGKLLKLKVTELVKSTDGEFAKHLEKQAKRLEQNSRAELALRMFGVMNKTLDIEPRHYAGRRDFEDNAEDIVARCLAVMREKEKDFSGDDLSALVGYQTNKMFGEIGKSFDDLPDQKKSELLDEIRKFIQELPADQREKLKEELGADEITDDYLKKALKSGALGAAFAATVEIGGFPFYIAAVKLVAWVTGLIGIALPFAFYTYLTSVIAVLASPFFLIPLLGGGGHYFYKKNSRSMQQRLVPLVVTQLTVTFVTSDAQEVDQDASQEALRLWSEARVKVAQYGEQLEELEAELTRARQRLNGIKKEIKTNKREKAQVTDRKAVELKSLALMAANCTWPASLDDKKTKLEQKARDLLRIQEQAARRLDLGIVLSPTPLPLRTPFWPWDWLSRRVRVSAANREVQRAALDLAEQAVQLWLSGERGFDEEAAAILKKLEALDGENSILDEKLGSLKKEKAASESEIARLSNLQLEKSTAKTKAEDRFWGLESLP